MAIDLPTSPGAGEGRLLDAVPQLGKPSVPIRVFAVALAALLGVVTGLDFEVGLLLGVAVLGAVTLMLKPEWATTIVIVVIYSNAAAVAVTVHGVPRFVSFVVPLLLLLPLAHVLLVRKELWDWTPLLPWILGFVVVQLVGTITALDRARAANALQSSILEGVCLFFLVVNALRTRAGLRRATWAILIVGAALGALVMFQTVTKTFDQDYLGFARNSENKLAELEGRTLSNDDKVLFRAEGPIGEKNRFAQILTVLIPIGMIRARDERTLRLRAVAAVLTLCLGMGVIVTYSRGAFVGLAIAMVAMAFCGYVRPRLLVAVAIAVVIALRLFPSFGERLVEIEGVAQIGSSNSSVDGAIKGRLTSMTGSLLVYADHPIWGVGPSQYPLYHQEKAYEVGLRVRTSREPHSLFPGLAAEHGTLGLIAFSGILVVAFRQCQRARRRREEGSELSSLATGYLLALVAYLGTGIFLHLAFVHYFWLLIALCAVCGALARREGSPATANARRPVALPV